MFRTKTYTAKLNSTTHENLNKFLRHLTFWYNIALGERIDAYKKNGISITRFNQQKSLTEIRNDKEYDHGFTRWRADIQQHILHRLDKAYQQFFKNCKDGKKPGFPRFKGRNRGIRSFESHMMKVYTGDKWNHISLQGVGKIRFKGDIPDNVKFVRIVKTPLRVMIQLVYKEELNVKPDTRDMIGIDVGITNNITISNGFQVPKREINRTELKRKQRKLSKAVKGSNNYRKKAESLRKEWQRTTEREKNEIHQLTTYIIKKFSANIAVEKLKIQNMMKNHNLSRSIGESQWGRLFRYLDYKAESAGGGMNYVNPRYTSKACSECGCVKQELSLQDRIYSCNECGSVMDRDINAAINIRSLGIKTSESGGNNVSIKTTPDMCPDIKIGSGSITNYSTYNDIIKVDTYVNSSI